MNPWKHIDTEKYTIKYVRFRKENKYIIDMIERGRRDIDYNERDFESVIDAFRKLNKLHNDLLEAAARNAGANKAGRRSK